MNKLLKSTLKKSLSLLLMLLAGTDPANADEYTYLTFETTDGAKVSVPASGLALTISGNKLNTDSRSFTISNLSKMYFSTSEETTGVENITVTDMDDITDIYELNGRKLTKDQLQNGVYVVKTKKGIHKIVVK